MQNLQAIYFVKEILSNIHHVSNISSSWPTEQLIFYVGKILIACSTTTGSKEKQKKNCTHNKLEVHTKCT